MEINTPWLKNKATGIVSVRSDKDDVFTTRGNPAVIDNMSNLVKVDDLQIAINPVQDLHGYDHPWVGGTGDNVLNASGLLSASFTSNSDGTYTFTKVAQSGVTNRGTSLAPVNLKAGKTYTLSWVSSETNFATNVATPRYRITGTSEYEVADTKPSVASNGLKKSTITLEHDCDAVQIYLNNDNYNIGASFKVSEIQINEGSDVLPWTPYENICPISGWTKATVTSSLKNLLQNTSSSSTNHGITFTKQADNTVVANGTADEDASFIINFTWNLDDGDYQMSGCAEGGSADKYYCFLWDRSAGTRAKDWDGNASDSSLNPTQIVKVRLEHGVNYGFYLRVKAGVTVSNIIFYPMICAKNHGTVYIKYTAKTATIDLGGTRYGGYVDLNSGVIRVTKGYVDLGTVNWSVYSSEAPGLVYTDALKTAIGATDGKKTHGICSAYWMVNNTDHTVYPTQPDGSIRFRSSDGRIYVKDTRLTEMTAAEVKTAMSGVQLVYTLAEDFRVSLTPSILKLAGGITYNFADTGRVVSIRYITPNWQSLIDPSSMKVARFDLDAGETTGRNLQGYLLRDRQAVKEKIEMEFPPMQASDYHTMMDLTKEQSFYVRYYSPYYGQWRVADMYVGDREGNLYYNYQSSYPESQMWTDIKFNFIER